MNRGAAGTLLLTMVLATACTREYYAKPNPDDYPNLVIPQYHTPTITPEYIPSQFIEDEFNVIAINPLEAINNVLSETFENQQQPIPDGSIITINGIPYRYLNTDLRNTIFPKKDSGILNNGTVMFNVMFKLPPEVGNRDITVFRVDATSTDSERKLITVGPNTVFTLGTSEACILDKNVVALNNDGGVIWVCPAIFVHEINPQEGTITTVGTLPLIQGDTENPLLVEIEDRYGKKTVVRVSNDQLFEFKSELLEIPE